jgi:hypothetical protein
MTKLLTKPEQKKKCTDREYLRLVVVAYNIQTTAIQSCLKIMDLLIVLFVRVRTMVYGDVNSPL